MMRSSHMFAEVVRTCDRIGIIRDWRLAAVDSVDTLRKRHLHTYTVTLDTPELAQAFAKDFGGICQGQKVCVSSRESLESVFLNYYGGGENA